LFLQGLIFCL